QEVLLEPRGERREFSIFRLESFLFGRGEPGAGANEIEMVALEQTQRLRVQAELGTVFEKLADAGIEVSVEIDRVAVSSQAGRQRTFEQVEVEIGVCAREDAEHRVGAIE